MLERHRGYQFGSLHHGCFIELCPSHQGSTGSFQVPEATVSKSETSQKHGFVFAAFEKTNWSLSIFRPTNNTGAHTICLLYYKQAYTEYYEKYWCTIRLSYPICSIFCYWFQLVYYSVKIFF